MGYSLPSESKPELLENRRRYFLKRGLTVERLLLPRLKHGTDVFVVEKLEAAPPIADAIVTQLPNVILGITNADCFPVYALDPVQKAVGLAHVGWKGAVGNIVVSLIKAFTTEFKSAKDDILVGIGPGLRKCHFEIQTDILPYFTSYPGQVIKRDQRIFVDLEEIITNQLVSAGMVEENIEPSKHCTFCLPEKYYSYRRDKSQLLETMISYIGIRD